MNGADLGMNGFHIQLTSEYRTVLGFRIRSYASTGHLKTGPFEIRTNVSGFRMASLDCFINKSLKNILFMTKRSRLAIKKRPVRFSNGRPSCFGSHFVFYHSKTGQIASGFRMVH